ncbi:MAG: hypothetical protein LBB44_02820 [Endomicrobium sp.]|jgi:hypothetical protein|nr:hypothetical protein [Endomicrobium sp.]
MKKLCMVAFVLFFFCSSLVYAEPNPFLKSCDDWDRRWQEADRLQNLVKAGHNSTYIDMKRQELIKRDMESRLSTHCTDVSTVEDYILSATTVIGVLTAVGKGIDTWAKAGDMAREDQQQLLSNSNGDGNL